MLMKGLPVRFKIPLMSFRKPAAVLSAAMIVLSFGLVVVQGLNFGIDFVGGSVIEISKTDDVTVEEVRSTISNVPGVTGLQVNSARGTGAGAQDIVVIRFKAVGVGDEDAEAAQQNTSNRVREAIGEYFPQVGAPLSSASVGPKVSGELLQSGLIALVAALVLMLAYIWFRFEWQFSLGAVLALTHDVILTIGMFALTRFEFNLTTIAALLTIIGYSMNDTVVVFDRVREEMRKYKKMPAPDLINLALNGTLSRTLLTSGTTLLALLAIFLLGGPVLRGMSFALIWGVIIGTYSSIFVASALLLVTGFERERRTYEDTPGFTGTT